MSKDKLGKKRINFGGIAKFIFSVEGLIVCAIPFAAYTFWNISEFEKKEREQTELTEELTSISEGKNEYELISDHVVRLSEQNAKWDFHFASEQVFVTYSGHNNRQDDVIPFDELNTAWVENALQRGCEIAQRPLEISEDSELSEADFEDALQNAQAFQQAHCAVE